MNSEVEKMAEEYAEIETVRRDHVLEAPTHIGLGRVKGVTAYRGGCRVGFQAGYAQAVKDAEAIAADGERVLARPDNDDFVAGMKAVVTKLQERCGE